MPIPTLQTQRLTLRPHTLADYPKTLALWTDPEVTRHIAPRPFTPEECWARLLRYRGHWAFLNYGFWLIEETQTGDFVGEAGFADHHRDIDPPLTAPELGWALAPSKQRQGYATEAVAAAVQWGLQNLPAQQCIISPGHVASIAIAKRCGFERTHMATYKANPTLVFQLAKHARPTQS
jgi:RimJ/RimL family protein N-acetyltransferase